MRDFLRGFRTLHFVGPCVTVFGSARVKIDSPDYELARKMGSAIARLGFTQDWLLYALCERNPAEIQSALALIPREGITSETARMCRPFFNERWQVQVDFQSGSENSSTIGFTCNVTRDFQFNPALYVNNGPKHDLFGYIVFTYTFHLWGDKKENRAGLTKSVERVAGAK